MLVPFPVMSGLSRLSNIVYRRGRISVIHPKAGPKEPQEDQAAILTQYVRRREVLDETKRLKIIAIVSNGSSRRTAARYVGCSPGTITRTAARHPEFGVQLARAEESLEIETLKSLRKAAEDPRYWRAAAWLLERQNPQDFALKITRPLDRQIAQLVAQIAAAVGLEEGKRRCAEAVVVEVGDDRLQIEN
jgi:hypothetical protein